MATKNGLLAGADIHMKVVQKSPDDEKSATAGFPLLHGHPLLVAGEEIDHHLRRQGSPSVSNLNGKGFPIEGKSEYYILVNSYGPVFTLLIEFFAVIPLRSAVKGVFNHFVRQERCPLSQQLHLNGVAADDIHNCSDQCLFLPGRVKQILMNKTAGPDVVPQFPRRSHKQLV